MKYKKVQLTALDWYGYDEGSDDRDFELGEVDMVGFLVKEDDKKVVVAMEHFKSHDTVRRVLSIPKGCIVKMKVIK